MIGAYFGAYPPNIWRKATDKSIPGGGGGSVTQAHF